MAKFKFLLGNHTQKVYRYNAHKGVLRYAYSMLNILQIMINSSQDYILVSVKTTLFL